MESTWQEVTDIQSCLDFHKTEVSILTVLSESFVR